MMTEISTSFSVCVLLLLFVLKAECKMCDQTGWDSANGGANGKVSNISDRSYVNLAPNWINKCYGVTSSFFVQCNKNGPIALQVWRPVSGLKFQLVGEYTTELKNCEDSSITLYQHTYSGLSLVLTESVPDLTKIPCCGANNHWGNQISSVEVSPDGNRKWELCPEIDYGGTCIERNSGDKTGVNPIGKTESIAITNGWERIPVRPGDLFGLLEKQPGLVHYKEFASNAASAGNDIRFTDSNVKQADIVSFPSSNVLRRFYFMGIHNEKGMTPAHANLPAAVQIAENVQIGSYVFDVFVKDWDSEHWPGTGDQLEYQIMNTGGVDQYFKIDDKGRITTKGVFDFENKDEFIVDVGARDNPDRAWVIAKLTVTITDVDEYIERVNLNATVEVNAQTLTVGKEVYDVDAVSDSRTKKTNPNSIQDLKYILVKSEPNDGAFTINEGTGKVTTTRSLILTQNKRYTLYIVVAETSGTYTTDLKTLDIVINNVDQPPYFTNLPSTVSVPEDTAAVTELFTVTARDPDGSTNTITANLDLIRPYDGISKFTYTRKTGLGASLDAYIVRTSAAPKFDYETVNRYELAFYTKDVNFQSPHFYLKVEITDVNEPPVCNPDKFETYIDEGLPVGTLIGNFSQYVTDPDINDTWTFQLSNIFARPQDRYFDMVNTTLVILNKIDLINKGSEDYILDIQAIDKGGLSCKITATIHVLDVNKPHYITNLPRAVEINALTMRRGDNVYSVEVSPREDKDVFTYTLGTPQPSDGLFKLDEKTGRISLTRDMTGWKYTDPLMYNMTVMVSDARGFVDGPLQLTVIVRNARYPPVVTNLPNYLTFDEFYGDRNQDRLLWQLEGKVGIREYELIDIMPRDEEDIFRFNTGTGELFLLRNRYLDYERYNKYTFTMRVKDDIHWSEPKNLTMEVNDLNERPTFNPRNYFIELDEETPVGTIIPLLPLNFTASDPDFNNTIYFESGWSYFLVKQNCLVVNNQFDRETETAPASFKVYVRDQKGIGSDGTVTVTYNDINDNAPVFRRSFYNESVLESAYGGTNIVKVAADDADIGINKQFEYSIENINNSAGRTYFQVHPTSGLIYVKHRPDYARYPVVTFNVIAVDKGIPALTGSAQVTVHIIDVNDVVPEFEQDFYNIDIPCDEKIGTTVVTVTAEDSDSAASNDLSYFYLQFNRHYAYEPRKGDVTVRESLRCEKKDVLYLLARDRDTTDGISNVCVVRLNQYNPTLYVVDIYLAVPIGRYPQVESSFIAELNKVIDPWRAHVKEVRGELDRVLLKRKRRETADATSTIVSVYATQHDLADDVDYLAFDRGFVPKEDLLRILRKDISGTPQDVLKTTYFSDHFVTKVEPKIENWFLDTTGGIVTTLFLTLFGLAALCLLVGYLYKKGCGRWWDICRPKVHKRKIQKPKTPTPEPEEPMDDFLFKLRYKHPDEYMHTKAKTGGVWANVADAILKGDKDNRNRSSSSSGHSSMSNSPASGESQHSGKRNQAWQSKRVSNGSNVHKRQK